MCKQRSGTDENAFNGDKFVVLQWSIREYKEAVTLRTFKICTWYTL